jgi:hypothetical protein
MSQTDAQAKEIVEYVLVAAETYGRRLGNKITFPPVINRPTGEESESIPTRLEKYVAQALARAREEQRERDAIIAHGFCHVCGVDIAAAIRAGGKDAQP